MNKKQRKRIEKYTRWMANELELRDWTICILDDPPEDPEHEASVKITYGRKYAAIRLCPDFFERSLESQRSTICHELIHCHLKGIEWQYNNLGGRIAPDLFGAVWAGITDQIEFGVDALADAIAKHLPVPKQVRKKKRKEGQ